MLSCNVVSVGIEHQNIQYKLRLAGLPSLFPACNAALKSTRGTGRPPYGDL
eukprot:SAG31_NODE_2457_length_5661_cov_94.571557_4_plen_51_part_00